MKCTNGSQAELQLQNRMLDELRLAIKAHGGEYSFYSEDDDELRDKAPLVNALCCDDRVEIVRIKRLYLDKYKHIMVEADKVDYDDDEDIYINNILLCDIDSIIEAIPPTEKVDDVSVASTHFPVWNEDYLDLVQEITSQAMPLFQKHFHFPRRECFNIIRSWVCLFIYEHCETDWNKSNIIKEIDKFINRELKQINNGR